MTTTQSSRFAWDSTSDIEIERESEIRKYSPDQERDSSGRFAGDGADLPTAMSGGGYIDHVMRYNDEKGCKQINDGLRSGKPSASVRETASKLNELIDKTPGISKATTVYRGIEDGEFAKQILSLKPGDTLTDKGFVSTSNSKDFASQFNEIMGHSTGALIEMTLPEGTKGLDMQHYWSDFPDAERNHEFLLPSGSSFRVDSVDNGVVRVTLTGGA